MHALPNLLKLLAARASSLLNLSDVGRDAGLPHTTLTRYLALLETVFLVDRYRTLSDQTALLNAIREANGRVNLSWGSNTIIQVAAGYADVAIEFAKGFATYDILPGLYIGLKAGLTILDLSGNPLTPQLHMEDIFATFRRDPRRPQRTPFIAAREPALAEQVLKLLNRK